MLNEARQIDCLCCRGVDAMLIALAKGYSKTLWKST